MQGAWCSTPRASLSAGPASPWFVACPLGVCAGNLHYLLLPWFTAFTPAVSDLLTDRRGTSSQSSYALTGGHGLILKSLVLSSIRGEASLGRASRNRWNEPQLGLRGSLGHGAVRRPWKCSQDIGRGLPATGAPPLAWQRDFTLTAH